ncbi:mitochondrial proton/calcium exchanger protein-like [Lycorma delicatula]|uniref:mitochondrial proton/calcium exchanger protein-like n=1 Tax=Lycorma delicatula TaxID=130591 RepID=UPI003F518E54
MGAVATVDKGELIDLKEKLENYRVEIEELKPGSEDETLRTVAEQRLYKVVDNMTVKIDLLVKDISSKKGDMKNLSSMSKDSEEMKKELLKLDEVLNVVKKLQKFPNNWRLKIITEMLSKMVVDKQSDSIKVDTLIKAVDLLGKENFHLSQEQIEEVIEMIKKEEFLDIENKVEKNLQEQNYKEEHDRRSSSPTASVKKEETETEKKKL